MHVERNDGEAIPHAVGNGTSRTNPKRKRGNELSASLARRVCIRINRVRYKFWLDPVRLEGSHGFRSKEINRIQDLIEDHQGELLEAWNEFFRG